MSNGYKSDRGSSRNGASSSMGDGDWICVDCKNVNFARRQSCNRCNLEREPGGDKKKFTEIGKAAAEKSRGLFSAEDWQCSKCANVNWARRSTCNMCSAPKVTEVEQRTGYGGGYNDRGVVEYKDRKRESDDEYDEFGRRKKRNESSGNSRKHSKDKSVPPLHLHKKRDSDDEDSEDGDNCDLSKYDLWGSENENEASTPAGENKPQKEKEKSKTRSLKQHTRSRSSSRSRSRSSSRYRRSRSRSDSSRRRYKMTSGGSSNHRSSRSDSGRRRSRSRSRGRRR